MSIIVNNSLSKLYGDVPLAEQYFTVTALEDCELPLVIPAMLPTTAMKSISYKFAGSNVWKTLANVNETEVSETLSLKAGQSVFLKGDAKQYAYNTDPYPGGNFANVSIVADGKYSVSGNIMSLLYGDDFAEETELPEPVGGGLMSSTFVYLFHVTYGNPNLVDAGDLILPATTLQSECYGYMFEGCTSLTTAPELPATTLEKKCYVSMFHTCTSLTEAPAIPATTLAQACCRGMMQNCSSLKSADYELPATVLPSACYQSMFNGCTLLSVAPTIDEEAITEEAADAREDMYKGCYTLNPPVEPSGKITITENGTDIDVAQYATADVNVSGGSDADLVDLIERDITSLDIPAGTTKIGDYAFASCNYLTSVTIPNSVTSIGTQVFSNCIGLTSVTIPNSVTSIGDYAFYSCSGLTSVSIGNSVTSIGGNAFYRCVGLTSVNIPNTVTSINRDTFKECSSLANVTIGNSVTEIGAAAFQQCTALPSVTIPASVTIINQKAFYVCSALASVTVEATTPPTLGSSVFTSTSASLVIYVPAESVETYKTASNWSAYAAQIQAIPTP